MRSGNICSALQRNVAWPLGTGGITSPRTGAVVPACMNGNETRLPKSGGTGFECWHLVQKDTFLSVFDSLVYTSLTVETSLLLKTPENHVFFRVRLAYIFQSIWAGSDSASSIWDSEIAKPCCLENISIWNHLTIVNFVIQMPG